MSSADALLNKYFPVHEFGFVALKAVMGGDESICEAARVSYGEGTKTVSDDKGLINYLIRHDHGTPLEMVDFKFHIGMPIFVHRQLVRHRISSMNEYSGRYSVMPMMFYSPTDDSIRTQSSQNKQGKSDEKISLGILENIKYHWDRVRSWAKQAYEYNLNRGVARELARIDLPLSMYTYFYWKINLRSLFNFLRLRLDPHAQQEIRDYAKVMAGMVKASAPLAYDAFERYQLNAVSFTQEELALLINGNSENNLNKRETQEYLDKLKPKVPLRVDLDVGSAKDGSFYEQLIKQHVVEA